ncbi:RecT family recombinase [Clostridium cadaveris]|uniref:recombinase RecT n=1 Tax=Clostridium cadaveris TaxID=1529 RepID=UPI0025A3C251|nr:RecT family recombinase [Clostridium cadaveris]MDM8310773.1 RecT family recombinase [Clostridium cadaveris]
MTESKAVTVQEKNVTDKVLNRIKDLEAQGNISFPKSYSYSNALKSAYLMLSEATDKNGKPVLEVCSQASVINALLDMTIQGLSPAKKQCYFIPYGGKLQLSKSYLGNIAATKRLKGVKDVFANVIYEDDDFEYQFDLEIGVKKITKHEQKIENISLNKIKGAYAIVIRENEPNYVEVMTIEQIRNAWNQGYAKGNSGAHKNFTDEMAKKTVINRACKNFVCTSDDSDLLIDSINRTNEYEPEDIIETTKVEVKEEIKEEANKEFVDVEVQPIHEAKEQVQMDMENEVDF